MPVFGTLADGIREFRHNAVPLLVVAAVVFVPLDLIAAFVDDTRGWGDVSGARFVVAWSVMAIGYGVAYAIAVRMLSTPRVSVGQRVAEALGTAARRLPTIIAVTVVVLVGTLAGLIALIVPGLILLVWWLLAYQAVMIEGRPWRAALRRSRELARGRFWPLLACALIISGSYLAADYAAWRIASKALPDTLAAWLAGAFVDGVITPLQAAITTTIYRRAV